jgi:hypothetical protein
MAARGCNRGQIKCGDQATEKRRLATSASIAWPGAIFLEATFKAIPGSGSV